jgi:hypothetical protein
LRNELRVPHDTGQAAGSRPRAGRLTKLASGPALLPAIPRKEYDPMRKEGVISIGAVVLAFLASQHHNLHMLLLAVGLGGAGMSFMAAFPMVRRVMLLMSLAMVAVIGYQVRDTKRPTSMRVAATISIIVTVSLVLWSIVQFGF